MVATPTWSLLRTDKEIKTNFQVGCLCRFFAWLNVLWKLVIITKSIPQNARNTTDENFQTFYKTVYMFIRFFFWVRYVFLFLIWTSLLYNNKVWTCTMFVQSKNWFWHVLFLFYPQFQQRLGQVCNINSFLAWGGEIVDTIITFYVIKYHDDIQSCILRKFKGGILCW